MTPDEAIATLEAFGPVGDEGWGAFRRRKAEAVELLTHAPLEALRSVEGKLRAAGAKHDTETIKACALALARLALGGEREACVRHVETQQYRDYWLEGLAELGKHQPVAALVRDVLTSAVLPLREKVRAAVDAVSAGELDFAAIAAIDPAIALGVVSEQQWMREPLGPLTDPVLTNLGHPDPSIRGLALEVLWRDGNALDPAQLARVRAGLDDAGPLSQRWAEVVVTQLLKARRRKDVDPLLDDPRPDVRRGAWMGLVSRREVPESEVPRLLGALGDADRTIADLCVRTLREVTSRKDAPSHQTLDALLGALGAPQGELVTTLLAEVAVLHASARAHVLAKLPPGSPLGASLQAPTLACARCRDLWDGLSWGRDEPKGLSVLEPAVVLTSSPLESSSLLRCPACQAHYLVWRETEYDVNSRHDRAGCTRLTLADLRREYGQHVTWEHPKLLGWAAAVEADLHHVDPRVRANAERERQSSEKA